MDEYMFSILILCKFSVFFFLKKKFNLYLNKMTQVVHIDPARIKELYKKIGNIWLEVQTDPSSFNNIDGKIATQLGISVNNLSSWGMKALLPLLVASGYYYYKTKGKVEEKAAPLPASAPDVLPVQPTLVQSTYEQGEAKAEEEEKMQTTPQEEEEGTTVSTVSKTPERKTEEKFKIQLASIREQLTPISTKFKNEDKLQLIEDLVYDIYISYVYTPDADIPDAERIINIVLDFNDPIKSELIIDFDLLDNNEKKIKDNIEKKIIKEANIHKTEGDWLEGIHESLPIQLLNPSKYKHRSEKLNINYPTKSYTLTDKSPETIRDFQRKIIRLYNFLVYILYNEDKDKDIRLQQLPPELSFAYEASYKDSFVDTFIKNIPKYLEILKNAQKTPKKTPKKV
jgi:hypothetical protein